MHRAKFHIVLKGINMAAEHKKTWFHFFRIELNKLIRVELSKLAEGPIWLVILASCYFVFVTWQPMVQGQ